MVSSAGPLLLDLDLLAQDEWSPVVTSAGASLEGLEARIASVTTQLERFNALADETSAPLSATAESSSTAAAGLTEVEAAATSAAASLSELQAADANAAAGAAEVEAAYSSMVAALGEVEASAAAAASGQGSLAASMSEGTAAADANAAALAEVQASTVSLSAEQQALVAALAANTAATEANTAAASSNAAAHEKTGAAADKASNGLFSIQTAGMAAAAGLAAITLESLKLGAGLEVADAKLVSFAGVSQSSIAGLNQQMLQLSANTGQAPKQIADGLYYTVSAGFAASDAMKVLTQSTQLATAAQTDSKTVVDVATSALRAYGMGADQTSHVLDVLTATTVAGKMEFADLAGSMGRLLPIAAQAGVSLEQVGASIATMTQKGLSVEEATTAVRGMLLALEAPSKQTRDELAQLGTTADQVRASIRDNGLLQTMSDLVDRTNGNMDSLHNLIPNVRALVGVLADAGSGGKDYQAALDAVSNSQGKAAAAWQNYEQTASASAARAKGQVIAAMTEMGLGMAQGIAPGVDKLNDLLGMLDKLGPGGHGGIAGIMQGVLSQMPGVGGFFAATGIASQGQQTLSDLDKMRENLGVLGPAGVLAANGLGALESLFKSGAQHSKEYADGVALATANIKQLAGLPSEKNPFDFIKDLQGQDTDLFAAYHQATTLEGQARADGNKKLADQLHADAQKILGEIDSDTNAIKAKRKELDDAARGSSTDTNSISVAAPPPGWADQIAAQQPKVAISSGLTSGISTAIADTQHLYDIMQKQVPAISLQALKNDVDSADTAVLRTATDLNKLLNAPNKEQDETSTKLATVQRIMDGLDKQIAESIPGSAKYNGLVKERGDLYNSQVAPLEALERSQGDVANQIKFINDEYNRGAISAKEANSELDGLTQTTITYNGKQYQVVAADNDQVNAAKGVITAHENQKTAVDDLAAANAVAADLNDQLLVPSFQNVGSTAQSTAGDVQTAASGMNTDLGNVGNVTPDLSGYEASLVSQASAAGAAARLAIEGQMRNIIASASVTIQTNWGSVGAGQIPGYAGDVIPGTPQGAPSGGGGGAGNVESLLDFDTELPVGLNEMLAFDASGPKPPSVPGAPKPAPIHIGSSAPAAAKGSGSGAAKGGGSARSGTASAAQGIAAAHATMQADVQDIQKQLDDALAEFDALVHPDGKNALLARLTADLTNADTVAGLADAERVLFREAVVQGGSAGANASADQLVNAWLQAASKGITDPAKLEELKAQAGKMLQALAEAMPDIAQTVAANKGIDLAAGLFSDLGSPDSVKTLTKQVAGLLESGRPDADEAIRHMLFGDGTPSGKQASDAAKVAQAVRNLLIQNVDLNDPSSVARLQDQLAGLQAALQAQATRQGLTIPVSLDQPDPNKDAGIPGLIPVPSGASGGSSPFSPRTALGGLGGVAVGRGGYRPPDDTTAAPSTPETPEQAAARVIQAGQPKTDAALEDELAKQVADAVLRGDEFGAIQIMMKAGSQEAAQRVAEKAAKIIQASAATDTQQVQALTELGVAKVTAIQATPVVSTNTSAEDKAADTQAQAALNPGSASSRVESEAQTLANLIEHAPGSVQAYLSRIPKADFAQVVSRAREIIKADAEKNKTSAADLAAENRTLNSAETAAAPASATVQTPEEQAKLQADDFKLKHSAEYFSSKEQVADSQAMTQRRLADPGGDFAKNSGNAGTVFLYAAAAVEEQIRQSEQAYKKMIEALNAQAAQKLADEQKANLRPIEVRVLSTINGRIVAQEIAYHQGQSQQYADLGMPAGRSG